MPTECYNKLWQVIIIKQLRFKGDEVARARVLLGMITLGLLVLLVGACTETDSSSPTTTLVLSDALTSNCERNATSGGFQNAGLAVGEIAVEFTLKDIQGNAFTLSELLSEKPVVMVFGSFT